MPNSPLEAFAAEASRHPVFRLHPHPNSVLPATMAGRLCYAAFADSGLQVFDVWESEEGFSSFGETLLPILSDFGVAPGRPHVTLGHNIIQG